MPYPKKHLNPDETVVLDLHPHWWFFAGPAAALIGAVAIALVILAALSGDAQKWTGWAAVVLIVLSAIWLVHRYFKWVTTNFVITNDRIIFRQGVLAKHGIEIPLERVNNVNFHQTIFERVLGAGDLLIESGGEDGQQRFTDVRKPQQVQNLIHAQVEAKMRARGQASATAAQQAPVFAPPVDVAGQLEKLEGLRDRGSLSQEEFELQKQRLLGT
jgi:uncharacterized membrane protein YdbT with pleckstrin-like domain